MSPPGRGGGTGMSPFRRAFEGGRDWVRRTDERVSRRHGGRRILVDSRTPVNYTMVAPVLNVLRQDDRIALYFTASEEPRRLARIYQDARGVTTIHPARAALMKFDAYVSSDFMWATLPRGTRRVQMFHGVAGKYSFDAPPPGMIVGWDYYFFPNERRYANFVASGALEPGSPKGRLIGLPKVDELVNGTYDGAQVLAGLGLDPGRPTILYAPTWSPASSLNALGTELVAALGRMPVNVVVKLHDRSRDLRERYSGGVDWVRRLRPVLPPGRGALAPGHDITPYLVAADLMITDHSSAGFEFLLRDRPIVRIHRPSLIQIANVHPDYVSLLASVSQSALELPDVLSAVERALAQPEVGAAERRRLASELFYRAGTATGRAVSALYDVLELAPAPATIPRREAPCQLSA